MGEMHYNKVEKQQTASIEWQAENNYIQEEKVMVSIASDHGGYRLKEHIKAYLTAKGISVLDCGCDSQDSCDYPIFGKAAAQAVAEDRKSVV